MSLQEALIGASGIAYSRLWRRSLIDHLEAFDLPLHEIPHVRGVPVDIDIPTGFIRVTEWPNALGISERSDADTVVRWDPRLAVAPPVGRVVRLSDDPTPENLESRTALLQRMCSRLEQLPGVARSVSPKAPLTILLTPGVPTFRLEELDARFPHSTSRVRPALGEFPGGIQLTVIDDVWTQPEQYAGAVELALRGKGIE